MKEAQTWKTRVIWYLFVSISFHSCTEEQNDIWHTSRQLTWYMLVASCGTKDVACCEARTISRPHRLHQSSSVQATLFVTNRGRETTHTHKLDSCKIWSFISRFHVNCEPTRSQLNNRMIPRPNRSQKQIDNLISLLRLIKI